MSDPFPAVVVEMPAEIDLTSSEGIPALVPPTAPGHPPDKE
jgi:hypothetical protein